MAASRGRSGWLLGVLVVAVALPAVVLTAFLAHDATVFSDGIARERAGLKTIDALAQFNVAALRYSIARSCGRGAQAVEYQNRANAARDAVDALPNRSNLPADWGVVKSRWAALPSMSARDADAFFDQLGGVMMTVSDGAGLTYDSDFVGTSLSDAVAYRFPEALAQLRSANTLACAYPPSPSLSERLDLKQRQALFDKLVADGMQDVSDTTRLAANRLPTADLARAYDSANRDTAAASSQLESYMLAALPSNIALIGRTSDTATGSLTVLADSAIAVIERMLELRENSYAGQRAWSLIPGAFGIVVAIVVAVVLFRRRREP